MLPWGFLLLALLSLLADIILHLHPPGSLLSGPPFGFHGLQVPPMHHRFLTAPKQTPLL
jgi:hypothetical protein